MRIRLYALIFIQGYVILSVEIIAIRQLIPFVGNGTDTVAIIIAAVLLPLAVGYYVGGMHVAQAPNAKWATVRDRLIRNMVGATIPIVLGLPYVLLEVYFSLFSAMGIEQRLMQVAIYASVFLIYPLLLLGQTIPLVGSSEICALGNR